MGLSKSMDVFGSTFSDEASLLGDIEARYRKDIEEAGSSPSKKDAAERRYQSSLKEVTNSVMRKDSNLRLEFPFRRSDENKQNLFGHLDYYENEGIITRGNGGMCICCGEEIKKDALYVDDDRSGVCSCLACANPNLDIDNNFYRIRIAK